MSTEAYPLQWPQGRKRTDHWSREQAKFDVSFARARDNIINEVKLLAGGRWGPDPMTVISSNVALRRDGLPLANQRQPEDTGVAVFFLYKKRQMSFACDRWIKVEHNMQAIAKTIEALRGIARWGTGDMLEAAFTGFMALPAPGAPREWWAVLGVHRTCTREEVKTAYRALASRFHPDKPGGSHEKMAELNAAQEKALQERLHARLAGPLAAARQPHRQAAPDAVLRRRQARRHLSRVGAGPARREAAAAGGEEGGVMARDDDSPVPCLIVDCTDSHEWLGLFTSVAGGRPLHPEPLRVPADKKPTMLQPDRKTGEAELQRLALAHPGRRFVLFEAALAGQTVKVPTHTTISGKPWGERTIAVMLSIGNDDGIPF